MAKTSSLSQIHSSNNLLRGNRKTVIYPSARRAGGAGKKGGAAAGAPQLMPDEQNRPDGSDWPASIERESYRDANNWADFRRS